MSPNQTQIHISLLAAMVIVAVCLLFLIITVISYHKKYRRLSRHLLYAEIKALESERSRIAKDLHDDFGQILSVIKMQVENIRPRDEQGKQLIQHATRHINDTLRRMRSMSQQLMPQVLFRSGSVKSIARYIDEINHAQSSLHIGFSFRGERFFDNPEKEKHLFRIIQELITNTLKHSQAKEMDIHVYRENKLCGPGRKALLHVFAKDDGIGFEENAVTQSGPCSGIRNIHDRVDLLNGNIFLQTAPGQGVQYEIEIPVTPGK